MLVYRGVAQLGSAPLWGSGGRGFKSRRSDSGSCLGSIVNPDSAGFNPFASTFFQTANNEKGRINNETDR